MKKMFSLMVGSFLGFIVLVLNFVNVANGQFTTQDTTYNPGVPGSAALKGDMLITSIKTFINRILGLLGLIALLVLLRGGFQMVTAAGDEAQYKKGFKILQQAGMGLLFIGVSWLFVSLIFWLINKFAGA